MPNHCENDLYLIGTDDDVAAVLAHIGAHKPTPEFDFNTLIPYPEKFRDMDLEMRAVDEMNGTAHKDALEAYETKWGTRSDGFNSGGIEWCRENWGTKWGAYDVARRDYHGVCLTYQTAWSPSKVIIVELAKRFPTVSFNLEYFERGMSYCGGLSCKAADDYYGDEPWHPGIVTNEWESGEYHGRRGG